MELIFNGFRPNSQRLKYAILTNMIFLSDSYLLIFYPFGMKNISFNSWKPDLSEYEKSRSYAE